jgi:hypothetical protein
LLFFLPSLVLRRREWTIEKGAVLTGSDAELLSCALAEVKTKIYEDSEASLDDTQALDALVSWFRTIEKEEQEKKDVKRILPPYVSALSLVRFYIGQSVRTVARADRSRAEADEVPWQARAVLATVINRKVPLSLSSLTPSGPCALVFPRPPHAKKARLVASP